MANERLEDLSRTDLVARLVAAERAVATANRTVQALAGQLTASDALARAAEAHAAELGLALGDLGETLGLAPAAAQASRAGRSPEERRIAYAARLLQRVRAAKQSAGLTARQSPVAGA